MTAQDMAEHLAGRGEPDHAGDVLRSLLAAHPDVAGVRETGSDDDPEAGTWYGLEAELTNGRRFAVDVQEL